MSAHAPRLLAVFCCLTACTAPNSGTDAPASTPAPLAAAPAAPAPAAPTTPAPTEPIATPTEPAPTPVATQPLVVAPGTSTAPRKTVKGEGITITETADGQVILNTTATWGEAINSTYSDCSYFAAAIPVLSGQLSAPRAKLLTRVCSKPESKPRH